MRSQPHATVPTLLEGTQDREDGVRWFAPYGAVIDRDGESVVFLGGAMIGHYDLSEAGRGTRNMLLATLASEPTMHFGHLAAAFKVSEEHVRVLRKRVAADGLRAALIQQLGAPTKISPQLRGRLHKWFAEGLGPTAAFERQRGGRVSRATISRERARWQLAQVGDALAAMPVPTAPMIASGTQLVMFETPVAPSPVADADDAVEADRGAVQGLRSRPVVATPHVQHLGTWLLIALAHQHGLHELAAACGDRGDSQRIAVDAVIGALAIGERTVEGVRRLATPTAAALLRADHVPTASAVRRRLWRLGEGGGARLHARMSERYLAAARAADDGPIVFYVDNHLRPYTGGEVIRKGWRMQDKQVVPGSSDYYVHDEDGRPVFRIDTPSHDSLSQWLLPIAHRLRAGVGPKARILLAFDRAGAFAQDMSALRDTGFELVTYERKPYPALPASAFERTACVRGDQVGLHETRMKNLGKGRGRVRRISIATDHGQVNFLAVSREPAERLIEILQHRWRQENGFKHGVERWGINRLDGRKVVAYPPDTIIPNPARRRLDRTLQVVRHEEGAARCALAQLTADHPRRAGIEQDLIEAVTRRAELELRRPSVPKRAPLDETELAGKLVHHTGELKAVIDTLRIVCANAEADLADAIVPHLRRPAEAKKVIANVLTAPGRVDISTSEIRVSLAPAANRNERGAIALLLTTVNRWKLTLPGDGSCRPIRFGLQVS